MAGDRFLVSARKYRPQTFSELVSQDHVGETLRNALRLNRVAHAYLFCGPRGVGKTSAARILAKAINCETPPEQRENMDPCRTCNSCASFEQGRSLNVIEIDAASNNGVDDIRALREAVRIPPQSGSKKVYIIDEVHMLSKAAFNALLKTLEEPPPFIQFIFATTEPHKLLPTVQSRCQRFDFRRISVPDIVDCLKAICIEEGIEADEASLRLIARKGDGALRDAFSTFDQTVILGGKKLVYDEIVAALGAVNIDTYFETTRLIVGKDRAGVLGLVERLASTGTDLDEFLSGLTDHLRDLLLVVTTGETELVEADDSTRTRYAEHAKEFAEPDLLRHLIVVNEAQDAMKRAVKPRLRLELTLLKMASLAHAVDLQKLLRHLDATSAPDDTPQASPRREAPVAAKPKPAPVEQPPTMAPSKPIQATALPAEAAPASGPEPETEAVPEAVAEAVPEAVAEAVPEAIADPVPEPETPVAAEPNPPPKPPLRSLFGAPALKVVRKKNPESSVDTTVVAAPAKDGAVPMSTLEEAWPAYIRDVTTQRIHVGALLQHTRPSSMDGDMVRIAVPDDFHERLLGRESEYLSERLRSVMSFEGGLSIQFFVSADVAIQPEKEEVDPMERVKKLRQDNPIIKALFDEFGGELVW